MTRFTVPLSRPILDSPDLFDSSKLRGKASTKLMDDGGGHVLELSISVGPKASGDRHRAKMAKPAFFLCERVQSGVGTRPTDIVRFWLVY